MDVLIPRLDNLSDVLTLPSGQRIATASGQTMGTTWRIDWVSHDMASHDVMVIECVVERLSSLNQSLSHWDEGSELSQFNGAKTGWHCVSPDLFAVVHAGLALAKDTQGAFDPSIGVLVNLWGFGASKRYHHTQFSVPTSVHIQAAMQVSGWQQLALNERALSIYQPGGLLLDLSGIAKGYALDQIALLLRSMHIESFLIEIGGECKAEGIKPDGQPWWVDIQAARTKQMDRKGDIFMSSIMHDSTSSERILARIALLNQSIAVSGNTHQYFEWQQQTISHTLDPRTGYPCAAIDLCAVLHESCMLADAYATVLCVMGGEQGISYLNQRNLAGCVWQKNKKFSSFSWQSLCDQ